MSRAEIRVDFASHQDEVNRMTVSQLNAVADIVLRLNSLDDESFALLRAILSGSFQDPDRETVPDSRA